MLRDSAADTKPPLRMLDNPIYFEGTDPRDPGVPSSPPVVGTPREQFEAGLTVAEWHGYMDVIGQHNM